MAAEKIVISLVTESYKILRLCTVDIYLFSFFFHLKIFFSMLLFKKEMNDDYKKDYRSRLRKADEEKL